MTTQAEYDAGIAAALEVAWKDLSKDVPKMFQSTIPKDTVREAVTEMAKAAIDAAERAAGRTTK